MKVFLDTANLEDIKGIVVNGYTTNPSLMKKAGVTTYSEFIKRMLECTNGLPTSFEVLSDEPDQMVAQGIWLTEQAAETGGDVYVKIPCVRTNGDSNGPVVARLAEAGVRVNVTCCLQESTVAEMIGILNPYGGIVSVFAGRLLDCGIDPYRIFGLPHDYSVELLWASPREPYNIKMAEHAGAEIITMPRAMLEKWYMLRNKHLPTYERETVSMFINDAKGIAL